MINIQLWENPLWKKDNTNPKWMVWAEGYVHSGDTILQALEGVINMIGETAIAET